MIEDREDQLDKIIADYLQAQEAGRTIVEADVIADHPELADELREFFDDLGQMNELAAPVVSQRSVLDKIRYFGDYELLEEIARGGMGIVYKARQTSLNRIVAIKLILSGHLASETDIKRFQTEAESAANLQHPHIVSVHEVGRHNGQSYFSMDYIDGKNLSELVREHPLPPKEAAGYVREIGEAIQYAHQQGTLHRDLKPSNVLIDQNDRVQITDFGLAMRVEGDSELTRTGQVLGTPSYMPPEQAQHKRGLIGPGSDIYSIGAVLYELLTGRPPFQADSAVETLRQVIETEPLSPRLLNPAVPKDLETICLKCLQKEPHKRYVTAQRLADDLGRFLQGEPILARPISRVARAWRWCKRKPAIVASLVSLGVALLAVMGLAIDQSYRQELETAYGELSAAHVELSQAHIQLESTNDELATTNITLAGINDELEDLNSRLQNEGQQTSAALQRAESLSYILHAGSAQRAWLSNDVERTEKLLEACAESNRRFEWHYLKSLCHQELQTIHFDHDIDDLSASSDGEWIAAVTDLNRLRLFRKIDDHYEYISGFPTPANVSSVQFYPDQPDLLVGRSNGVVDLIRLPEGKVLETISLVATQPAAQTDAISSLTEFHVSADESTLAAIVSFPKDTSLTVVWRRDTPESVFWIDQPASKIALSPDGKHLVQSRNRNSSQYGTRVESILVWDTISRQQIGKFTLDADLPGVDSMRFIDGGQTLLTGHEDSTLRFWKFDPESISEMIDTPRIVKSHDGPIWDIVELADGRLLTAGSDRAVRLWDSRDFTEEKRFCGHRDAVTNIVAVNSGERIISAGADRTIRIWQTDRNPGSERLSSELDVRRGCAVEFSRDGRQLACLGTPFLWITNVESRENTVTKRLMRLGQSLAFAPDSSRVLNGGMVDSLTVYRTDDLKKMIEIPFKSHRRYSSRVAFSPDNEHVAVATGEGISVWDLSDPDEPVVFPINHTGMISDVTFSPDGKYVAFALGFYNNEKIAAIIYDPLTRQIQADFEVPLQKRSSGIMSEGILDLEFSPDGTRLAAAIGESMGRGAGEVVVWDVTTQQMLFRLQGYRFGVYSLAFSPDGTRLATGGGVWSPQPNSKNKAELKIWDMESGQEIVQLQGHDSAIISVDFSADGRMLASASCDRTLRLWGDLFPRPHQLRDLPEPEISQATLEQQKQTELLLKIAWYRNRYGHNPDSLFAAYQLAALLRYTGDVAGYRSVCREMREAASDPEKELNRHALLMSHLFFPEGEVTPQVFEIAEDHADSRNINNQRMLGLACYRLGMDQTALKLLKPTIDSTAYHHSKLISYLSLALVQLRLELLDEARENITAAVLLHSRSANSPDTDSHFQPWGAIPSLWREVEQAMKLAGVEETIPVLPPPYHPPGQPKTEVSPLSAPRPH